MTSEYRYVAESDVSPQAVVQALKALLPMRERPATPVRVTLLDTFDGRLRQAGGQLTRCADGGAERVEWTPPGGAPRVAVPTDEPVAFAWNLPDGTLRSVLSPILGVRRLLPLVEIAGRTQPFDVLDERGKVVARLRIDAARARLPESPDDQWASLPIVLTAMSLRGYERECRELLPVLASRPGFAASPLDLQALALRATGAVPTFARFRVELDEGVRADAGMRQLLLALLDVIIANEKGVKEDLDSDFLHDFRVAIRRTRCLLGQIRNVLPPEATASFLAEFAWLGRITGPRRDLDVLLLAVRDWSTELPAAGVKVLLSSLQKDQRAEHRLLSQRLEQRRYQTLIASWTAFLRQPPSLASDPPDAARALLDVTAQRAWRLYGRLRERASAIDGQTPEEAIHRVRIDAKKLRYVLDAVRSLHAERRLASPLEALARLQKVLGRFNDTHVQQRRLRQCRRALGASARSSAAVRAVLHGLDARQRDERVYVQRQMLEQFARFCDAPTRSAFRRALRVGRKTP